jgi:hypothetical protein
MIAEQFQEFKTVSIHTLPVSLSYKNNGDSRKNRLCQSTIYEERGNTA